MPPRPKESDAILEEIGGDEFASLEEAQQAALPFLVDDFVATIRAMIAEGDLIILNGRLIVNPNKRDENGISPVSR